MKPFIGVTSDFHEELLEGRPWNSNRLLTSYSDALVAAGGIPVILPLASPEIVEGLLSRLDGLILSGGNDIPPDALGEPPHPKAEPMPLRRWDSECLWLDWAVRLNVPVLGICLGMQVMNVVAGGKMIQDIPDLLPNSLVHGTPNRLHRHQVEIAPSSRLAALAPALKIEITSSHHQAVRDVPPPYQVTARSEDGVIEAIEDPRHEFHVGVQWHPERDILQPNWLLQGFVRHCATQRSGSDSRTSVGTRA